MKFFYQILTTPTADTPGTTILLSFPEKRYLFGHVSEGTQRAFTENGVRHSYLTDLFITGRTEWATNGGLIGVILTLADAHASSATALADNVREGEARRQGQNGAKSTAARPQTPSAKDGWPGVPQGPDQRPTLTVHGGRNLAHTVATARRFVFRKGMPLDTREYGPETPVRQDSDNKIDPFEQPTWSDNNIKVWALPVMPTAGNPVGVSESGAISPRKRRLEEFQELRSDTETLDQQVKDQAVRESIVNSMFNSTWQMDSLVEMSLPDVRMPATIFVRNPNTKDLEKYTGPMPGGSEPVPDIKVLVRLPWPGALIEKLPPTRPVHEALSYIVRNHDLRGKFDPKKAQELKVRKGPDYAKLTRGESVQSEDGKTVTPDMVLGPTRLGRGTAIIDLPSPDYVDGLISRPEWQSPAVKENLQIFIWILGPGVGAHPRLQEFVTRMSHCKHLVSGTDYCPNYLAMQSSAGSTIRLAKLNSDNFYIPVHDNVTVPQAGTPTAGAEGVVEAIQNSPLERAERGLIIDMEPKFEMNLSEVTSLFNPAKAAHRIPRAVEKRVATIRHRMKKPSFQQRLQELRQDLPGAEAEIITLGTGSSIPSKYRNVSATLLKVPGYGYYLLDCGENTLGQLKRAFRPDELREVLQNLRMIWISHLHADHHLGTASLIKAWYNENYPGHTPSTDAIETDMAKILQEKRLFVVSEVMMIGWLEEYAGVENYGFDKLVPLSANPVVQDDGSIKTSFIYRHCRADGTYEDSGLPHTRPATTTLRFDDPSSPLTPLLRSATGLSDVLTALVSHCKGAMAVSLVFPDGFKVSYSGDCRPSAKFAAIGQGSTVLIHEATFQDDMRGSAVAKKHSTTAEALEVGRKMGARMILLTHFSQRYQKIAHLDQQERGVEDVGQAAEGPAEGLYDVAPDEPEESPRLQDRAFSSREDMALSSGSPSRLQGKPQLEAPVAAAFDFMHVRVKDIPIAQVFAPAFEKMVDILERVSSEETERLKEQRRKEEEAAAAKKGKKQKKKLAASGEEALSEVVSEPVVQPPKENARSAWSASESEKGWTTSESEDENGEIGRAGRVRFG
jgi:ribonuclease Z